MDTLEEDVDDTQDEEVDDTPEEDLDEIQGQADTKIMTLAFAAFVVTREQAEASQAFETCLLRLKAQIDQFKAPITKVKQVSPEFENHVHRIQTILLPALPRKLCQMCDLLFSPIYFLTLDAPQFTAAIELLAEVEDIINQISFAMNSFWSPTQPQPSSVTEAEKLKRYRCQRTQSKILDVLKEIAMLLDLYHAFLGLAEIRTILRKAAKIFWRRLIDDTHGAGQRIEYLIKWFDLSHLAVIQDHWREISGEFDYMLSGLAACSIYNGREKSEPLEDFLPIIKLARLFFNKISNPSNTKPHPISQMSLSELLELVETSVLIRRAIKKLYEQIETEPSPTEVNPALAFDLEFHFKPVLLYLEGYLNRQLLNPNSPKDLYETHIQWYKSWRIQFMIAVDRFHRTFERVFWDHFDANGP